MLILENISYQTAKKAFANGSRKKIRFSINQHLITSKQNAKVKSQTLIEWSESIPLPLFFNQQYRFEIFESHQFGYNPEQLSVGLGGISISEEDRFCTWQVSTDRGNKLGFLSAKIRRKLRYAPNVGTEMPESQVVSISSIIAHVNEMKQKRGYVVISIMGKQHSTELSKSKSGELLFTEYLEIQKTDQITEAKVEVFSFDAKTDKSDLIASGTLKLDSQHPEKRVIVKNEKGVPAGDVFVDYKISQKQAFNASKQLTKIVQSQRAKMTVSRLQPTVNLSTSRTLNISRNIGQFAVRMPIPKKERVSVVGQNTKIFMPTQKRFQVYQDKQNNIVSYLKDRDELDMKNKHSKRYYRGASIGKGQRIDFTSVEYTPGVGGYNLPSIWDRY